MRCEGKLRHRLEPPLGPHAPPGASISLPAAFSSSPRSRRSRPFRFLRRRFRSSPQRRRGNSLPAIRSALGPPLSARHRGPGPAQLGPHHGRSLLGEIQGVWGPGRAGSWGWDLGCPEPAPFPPPGSAPRSRPAQPENGSFVFPTRCF